MASTNNDDDDDDDDDVVVITTTSPVQEAAVTGVVTAVMSNDPINDATTTDTSATRGFNNDVVQQQHDHHDHHQQRPTLERGTMGRLSLRNDGMNFDIPTNMGAKEHVIQTHGTTNWRTKLLHIMHTKTIEYTLAGLLFLDIILLFTELMLLSYYPHCTFIIRDAISCCSANAGNLTSSIDIENHNDSNSTTATETTNHFLMRLLESVVNNSTLVEGHGTEETEGHESICEYPSVIEDYSYAAGCDEHRYNGVHVTEKILFYLTIIILSIFWIELNCVMVALSPSIFFHQFFFALDYCIITISLILEITFYLFDDVLYQSLSGFLVIFRIWRFVRIGHGIVELTNEAAHREYDKLVIYTKELRTIIRQSSPNQIVTLPTNYPEMDLFFNNYDSVHDTQQQSHPPKEQKMRLSTVHEE